MLERRSSAAGTRFTAPASRHIYAESEQAHTSRVFTADLRGVYTREGPRSRAAALVAALLERSAEFAELWGGHDVGVSHHETKHFRHPEVGELALHCQMLHDIDRAQALLVFTATPGTESHEKLRLLSVIGDQRLHV